MQDIPRPPRMPKASLLTSALLLVLALGAVALVWRYFPQLFTGRRGPVVPVASSRGGSGCERTLHVLGTPHDAIVQVRSFGFHHRTWTTPGGDQATLRSLPCDRALELQVQVGGAEVYRRTFSVSQLAQMTSDASSPEEITLTVTLR